MFGAASRTFAGFTCAREDQLCLKLERLSFEQAAASAISGVTALIGLRDMARVKAGQSVCVIGAGGGMGRTLREALWSMFLKQRLAMLMGFV